MLVSAVEDVVKKEDVVEFEVVRFRTTIVFQEEAKLLRFAICVSFVAVPEWLTSKALNNMYEAKRAIHYWREGLPADDMLWCLHYIGIQDFGSVGAGLVKDARNVQEVSIHDF